jgi:hypothetical protein
VRSWEDQDSRSRGSEKNQNPDIGSAEVEGRTGRQKIEFCPPNRMSRDLDISPKITSIEDENNDTHLTFLKPGL